MENFNINNEKINNKKNKQEDIALTNEERMAFREELEMINILIEESLEDEDQVETTKFDEDPNQVEDPAKNNLEMKQSYNDVSRLYRKRIEDIGILKNDRTGQSFKASGEDT